MLYFSAYEILKNIASTLVDLYDPYVLFLLSKPFVHVFMFLNRLFKLTGIVGHISPKTWAAMEVFLASIATEEYESMASALIEMGATNKDFDTKAFARDLEKIFSSIQASIWNLRCLRKTIPL